MAKTSTHAQLARQQQRRSYWQSTLRAWHWISSAICLACMLLFAFTGLTLNHAGSIEAKPRVVDAKADLPPALLRELKHEDGKAPVPGDVAAWLDKQFKVSVEARDADWSSDAVYLSMPRPGGDAWLSIDRETGAAEYETTDRGWISYLNDLHKGRNAGPAWGWFIDLFAVTCLVFCISGLLLLWLHAHQRRLTWPYVGLGVLVPLVLALIFIH